MDLALTASANASERVSYTPAATSASAMCGRPIVVRSPSFTWASTSSRCAERIASMIWQEYTIAIPEEEMMYLTVYIRRITKPED